MSSPPPWVRLRATDPSESTLVLEGPLRVNIPITVSLCSCRLPLSRSPAPDPGYPPLVYPRPLCHAPQQLCGSGGAGGPWQAPPRWPERPPVHRGYQGRSQQQQRRGWSPLRPLPCSLGCLGMPTGAPAAGSDPASEAVRVCAPALEEEARSSPAMTLRVEGSRAAVAKPGVALVAGLSPGAPPVGVPVTALVTSLALEVVDREGSMPAAALRPPRPLVLLASGSAEVGELEAAPTIAVIWFKIPSVAEEEGEEGEAWVEVVVEAELARVRDQCRTKGGSDLVQEGLSGGGRRGGGGLSVGSSGGVGGSPDGRTNGTDLVQDALTGGD